MYLLDTNHCSKLIDRHPAIIQRLRLGLSDNDLWIAAIAKRRGFIIVSADDGFEPMKAVAAVGVERWWSPGGDS